MKKSILTILTLMSCTCLYGQSTLSFSQFEKKISTKNVIIFLDTTQNIVIKVKESHNYNLKVDVSIESPVSKKGVIGYLKKEGRYQLKIYENPQFYASVLSLKNKPQVIIVNNAPLKEIITYTIYLPPNTNHKIKIPSQKTPDLAVR